MEPDEEDDVICTCEGYIHRNQCSHQKEALELLCRWDESDSMQQTKMQYIDGICPRCLGPTMEVEL